jgi:hypothetical protein
MQPITGVVHLSSLQIIQSDERSSQLQQDVASAQRFLRTASCQVYTTSLSDAAAADLLPRHCTFMQFVGSWHLELRLRLQMGWN